MKKTVLLIVSLLLSLSTVLSLASCNIGQPSYDPDAPVYTGMTVSNSSPIEVTNAKLALVDATDAPENEDAKPDGPLDKKEAKPHKPLGDGVVDHFGISAGKELYYAFPEEDIYITVKLENPSDYEILSFTLNGKKYSSYMFEPGSDMENLVLKVNVGDTKDLIAYTIDAIKYVDGENIKDVRMNGEKTVNVGVYNKNMPTSEISISSIADGKASFAVTVSDPEKIITNRDGKVYLALFDGQEIIAKEEISVDEATSVSFDGLVGKVAYTAATVALVDAYDGEGVKPHIISEHAFLTETGISAYNLAFDESRALVFSLAYSQDAPTLTEIVLTDWYGDTIFRSSSVVDRIDSLPGGKLTLTVKYSYEKDGEAVVDSISSVIWNGDFMLPVKGQISARFDDVLSVTPEGEEIYHCAIDALPTTDDLSVYATTDGTVISVTQYLPGSDPAVDGCVEILDLYGYIHKYKYVENITVKVGDTVRVGDVLGNVYESSGDLTEGAHIHYELCDENSYPLYLWDYYEYYHFTFGNKTIFKEGLVIEADYAGETVVHSLSFRDYAYEQNIIMTDINDTHQCVTFRYTDKNTFQIRVDFSKITKTTTLTVEVAVRIAKEYVFVATFELTLIPSSTPAPTNQVTYISRERAAAALGVFFFWRCKVEKRH